MKFYEYNKKEKKGITLISLIITIIILLILAGVVLMILEKSNIFNVADKSTREYNKQEATEIINMKITKIQMDSYAKSQKLATLQYLADELCEDEDIEYVLKKKSEIASLEKIEVSDVSSIFTKLKKYPYEFEINASLQLASINGETTSILNNGLPTKVKRIIETDKITKFEYKEKAQEYIVPESAYYKIECWGASGGDAGSAIGGKGAYTDGIIYLSKNEKLYIYTGEQGKEGTIDGAELPGTFNGGGPCSRTNAWGIAASGGGATDIRIASGEWSDFNSLKNRIMVAAGGGGAFKVNFVTWRDVRGGDGGNQIGGNGNVNSTYGSYIPPKGGTQINGGLSTNNANNIYVGSFGKATRNVTFTTSGAGSGYYGGAIGTTIQNTAFSGAGGSSFISGNGLCNAIEESSTEEEIIHTGSFLHYSGKYFIFSKMLAGNESMPSPNGEEEIIGNTGNGSVKITQVYFE